jgi:hypothetical protein
MRLTRSRQRSSGHSTVAVLTLGPAGRAGHGLALFSGADGADGPQSPRGSLPNPPASGPGAEHPNPAAAHLPDWPARAPAGNAPYDLICTPQLRSAEAPAVVPNQADTCADARRLRLLSVTSFPQPPSSSSGRVQGCRLATRQGSGPAAPTVFDPVCARRVRAFRRSRPPKAGSPVIVDSYLRISAVIVHDNPLASVKWRLMQLRTLFWRHRQDAQAGPP